MQISGLKYVNFGKKNWAPLLIAPHYDNEDDLFVLFGQDSGTNCWLQDPEKREIIASSN